MEKAVMFNKSLKKISKRTQKWALENLAGLFIFNLIILFLVLLRYAGYFAPFLTININVIYIISLILSVFLLKANSKNMLLIALGFWLLAAFLKCIKIDIWADRTVEYFFQALLLGVFISLVEL